MSEINTPESIESGIPEIHFSMRVAELVQTPVDDTLMVSGMAADAKATGDAIAAAKSAVEEEIEDLASGIGSIAQTLFPVGAIYCSIASTAPAFIAGATWQEIMIPTTWGDLEDGSRSYTDRGSEDTPGTLHFWRRVS